METGTKLRLRGCTASLIPTDQISQSVLMLAGRLSTTFKQILSDGREMLKIHFTLLKAKQER